MENLNPLTSYSSTEPIDSHRDLNRTLPRSELQRICQSESIYYFIHFRLTYSKNY